MDGHWRFLHMMWLKQELSVRFRRRLFGLEVIVIEYFRSLDAALLAFAETADLTEYLAHCERWNVGMADSADRQLVTAHKCITARVTMPEHHRERSRQWLVDRGYQPFG